MSVKQIANKDEEIQKRNPEFVRIRLQEIAADMIADVSFTDFKQMVPSLKNKASTARNLYELQKQDLLKDVEQDINHMYTETNLEEKFAELNELLINSKKPDKLTLEEPVDIYESQLAESRKQILFEKKQKFEKMVREQQALLIIKKNQLILERSKLEPLMKQVKTTSIELKAELKRNK